MNSRADQQTGPKRDADPTAGGASRAWREGDPVPPPRSGTAANLLTDDIVSGTTLEAGQRVEVPVVEEQLSVEKRIVEKGQVVVHVRPTVERQELEVELLEEAVEVERVPVNRFVDAPVPVRQEGDVTIVPVFEEVLVVEKRLMLKEEIRLVRRKVATRERREFDLRKEEVQVLRTDAPAAPPPGAGTPVAKSGASVDGGRRSAAHGEVP
jgi:uncharacterized protein (TIGR02271 family)